MNLIKLFETQKLLDEKIVKEKGLEGQDLLPMKILALQVELGELCNEWRGFKFWSLDRNPRTKLPITAWGEPYKNPLLEEYVDCLHFILSIGLDKGFEEVRIEFKSKADTVGQQFDWMFRKLSDFSYYKNSLNYNRVWEVFIGLGELLGFTWEQIEIAYYDKNKINHLRQESGY